MDGSVQNGIRQSRIREAGMPIGHRQLRSNQGGRFPKAIIKNFQQILSSSQLDGIAHPVVQDQHIGFVERAKKIEVRTVLSGLRQGMQEAGSAHIANKIA